MITNALTSFVMKISETVYIELEVRAIVEYIAAERGNWSSLNGEPGTPDVAEQYNVKRVMLNGHDIYEALTGDQIFKISRQVEESCRFGDYDR